MGIDGSVTIGLFWVKHTADPTPCPKSTRFCKGSPYTTGVLGWDMNIVPATVMLTVVGVDKDTCGCSCAFRFIIRGCTAVCLPDDCSAPKEYLLVSEARDVRSIPWSVIIIGAGLAGALRSTTLVLGIFEILQRDIFSIDPRLYAAVVTVLIPTLTFSTF